MKLGRRVLIDVHDLNACIQAAKRGLRSQEMRSARE